MTSRLISSALDKLENRNCNITDEQIREIIRTHSENRGTSEAIAIIARSILHTASRQSIKRSGIGMPPAPAGRGVDLGNRIPAIINEFIDEHPHLTADEMAAEVKNLYLVQVSPSQILKLLSRRQEASAHLQRLNEQFSQEDSISSVPLRDLFLDTGCTAQNGSKEVDLQQFHEFKEKFTIRPNPKSPSPLHSTISYRHPESKTTALYIYPIKDRNYSFALKKGLRYRLLAMSRDHSVKVVYVGNIREMQEVMNQYREGEVQHLVIGGHGNERGLIFGDSVDSNDHQLSVNTDFMGNNPFSILAPNATVFVDSCRAGKSVEDGENFQEWVSRHAPGRHVYASKIGFKDNKLVVDDFRHWNARVIDQEGNDQMSVLVH
ncbi:MAG: hypothetical protein WB791_03885 [Waddliaceae bacterium]